MNEALLQRIDAGDFVLQPFQYDYIFSKARYPAQVSGWGTGKTLDMILRNMLYCEEISDNLGIVFRREAVDLHDSTILDFEKYTGIKVNSKNNAIIPSYKSGHESVIMFRHLDSMNIQNVNLGWFSIEQAEELPTDEIFFTLHGRLRRRITPSEYFMKLGLPYHTGGIIANVAGDNWIKRLWKENAERPEEKQDKDYQLVEASTLDNADVLNVMAPGYVDNLMKLKEKKPEIFKQFVLNDWNTEAGGKVFGEKFINGCVFGEEVVPVVENEGREVYEVESPIPGEDYTMGGDFAKHEDNFSLTVIRNSTQQVVYFEWANKCPWSTQRARTVSVAQRYNNAVIIPDSTGVGDPITEDLVNANCNLWREADRDGFVFNNRSKENLVDNLVIFIEGTKIKIPKIKRLIDELRIYEVKKTPSGKVSYNAPTGRHDDCVISLALACWAFKNSADVLYWSP